MATESFDMQTHKGRIVAAANVGGEYTMTVQTNMNGGIQLGREVLVIDREGISLDFLNTLFNYLTERPALIDDKEVKDGCFVLRKLLNR